MVIAAIIWYSTWYINQNISFSKFQFIQRTFSGGNETIESGKKMDSNKEQKNEEDNRTGRYEYEYEYGLN